MESSCASGTRRWPLHTHGMSQPPPYIYIFKTFFFTKWQTKNRDLRCVLAPSNFAPFCKCFGDGCQRFQPKHVSNPYKRLILFIFYLRYRYDVDMRMPQTSAEESAKALTVVKVKDVLNFDGSLYKTKRVFATAPDKTKIPMSMVYRKDLFDDKPEGPVATLLYGYMHLDTRRVRSCLARAQWQPCSTGTCTLLLGGCGVV